MKIINLFVILMLCWCFSLHATNNNENTLQPIGCKVKATVKNVSCVINNTPSNDGSIALEITGYTGPLEIKWFAENGQGLTMGDKDQTNLSIGTYAVEVYDNGSLAYKASYTITQPNNFTIQTEIVDNKCYDTEEGSIKITAAGCSPPYYYSIDGGANFYSSNFFENLKKGDYDIIVKDSKGCEISKTVKVDGGEYLSVHHPDPIIVESCLTQQTIDNKFKEWLKKFHFFGGTNPKEHGLDVTPPSSCGGATTVEYVVTDDCGVKRNCSSTFTVPIKSPLNFINAAQDINVSCNNDVDTVLQNWLESNAAALADSDCPIVWTNNFTEAEWEIICDNNKFIEVTFTADNGCSQINTSAKFTIKDTEAPTFNEELPQDISVACNAVPEATILTATDTCDDTAEVVFEETFTNEECGTHSIVRTWTAMDCAGNKTTHSQTITIEDTEAPTFNEELPQDISVACNAVPEAPILTATDTCDDTAEVAFEETFTNGECGSNSIVRTWTAMDCAGNKTTHSQTITIEDTEAPTFNEELPQDISVACNAVPEAPILTVTDTCDDTVEVIYKETSTSEECGTNSIVRTWTAMDCAGNEITHSQTIIIEDNEAPVLITSYEKEITISCEEIPEIPELLFDDRCNTNLDVSFEEQSNFNSEGEAYDIIRTWTVTDNCENEAIYTQNIHVRPQNLTPLETQKLRLCVEDATYNLFDLFPDNYSQEGVWEVINGNPSLNASLLDPSKTEIGNYEISFIPNNKCTPPLLIQIDIHDDCVVLPCNSNNEIIISKAITPNGDPYNEYFTVTGIEECGFTMTLKVFNRWGAIVYQSENYQNNWNGYTTSGIGGASQIPTGTYYYIITILESGYDPINGYIYVGTSSK